SGQPSDWTPEAFRRLDDNNDGRISRREWRYDDDTFRNVDRNNDGFIEEREYIGENVSSVDPPSRFDPASRFDQMDVNHDGRVTRREWTGNSETFEWLDRNNDGVLSRY